MPSSKGMNRRIEIVKEGINARSLPFSLFVIDEVSFESRIVSFDNSIVVDAHKGYIPPC